MDDVKELCKRVIIIDHGEVLFDGSLEKIIKEHAGYKVLALVFGDKVKQSELGALGTILSYDSPQATIQIKRDEVAEKAAYVLKHFPVVDLNIEEPAIEDVIRDVFTSSSK